MKIIKKSIPFILSVLLICCSGAPAFAADQLPDLDRKGSITVTVRDTESQSKVSGGALRLYKVASVKLDDGNYSFTYTKAFSSCPFSLEKLSSQELAQELADYAADKKAAVKAEKKVSAGTVRFSDLELGLYLVTQDSPAEGYSRLAPFLVTVPLKEGSGLIYDVDASPKAGTVTKAQESGTSPGSEPAKPGETRLPQTGQLWWPVPLFAAAGLTLFVIGWILRRNDQYE
ncbi:hypothetical protein LI177_07525 [bacterium 210820-DFI.6.37]|nr:hypothetical protein [bacterium 210820-DFI.6.37]